MINNESHSVDLKRCCIYACGDLQSNYRLDGEIDQSNPIPAKLNLEAEHLASLEVVHVSRQVCAPRGTKC